MGEDNMTLGYLMGQESNNNRNDGLFGGGDGWLGLILFAGILGGGFGNGGGLCSLGNAINTQTRDIIDNQNANYRAIMDFLVQEKLSSKDARIAELTNQVSQANQNAVIGAKIDASIAEVLRRTGNDCPVPAYVVPNPNCCYGNPLGVGYNGYGGYNNNGYGGYNNNGCGCG